MFIYPSPIELHCQFDLVELEWDDFDAGIRVDTPIALGGEISIAGVGETVQPLPKDGFRGDQAASRLKEKLIPGYRLRMILVSPA